MNSPLQRDINLWKLHKVTDVLYYGILGIHARSNLVFMDSATNSTITISQL
jgi:hypothetical protein